MARIGLNPASRVSYSYRMRKTAISVTLAPENLLWLRAQAQAGKGSSVSAVLDALLQARRTEGPVRSIVGRVRFPQGERGLLQGQREIRQLFERSLSGGRRRPRRRD